MHDEFLKVVADAVKETFWTMLMLKVAPEEVHVVAGPLAFDGVSSVVTFQGKLRGALSLHCSEAMALKATSLLMRAEIRQVSEEVLDTIGELTHMIAGATKRRLRHQESLFDLALPVSKAGTGHCISPPATWPATVIRFRAGEHAFDIITSLEGVPPTLAAAAVT